MVEFFDELYKQIYVTFIYDDSRPFLSLIKSVNVIRSLSCKNPFVQSLRGCDFFKPEKNKSLRR